MPIDRAEFWRNILCRYREHLADEWGYRLPPVETTAVGDVVVPDDMYEALAPLDGVGALGPEGVHALMVLVAGQINTVETDGTDAGLDEALDGVVSIACNLSAFIGQAINERRQADAAEAEERAELARLVAKYGVPVEATP